MSKKQKFEIIVAIGQLLCYNRPMNNLYYATFERGIKDAVKMFISKTDKNSRVKKLNDDSVLFFGGESFKQNGGLFKSIYVVLDSVKKTGAGAVNAEMKHILERKDLKIFFPKEISSFKFVVSSEYENSNVDAKLKAATEIALRRITKRAISFNASNAELAILAKKDGDVLFMKRVYLPADLTKFEKSGELSYDMAFLMNFLSEPCTSETVVDPFAESGKLCYIRALCFKKATVIAACADEENLDALKKQAKHLKDKHFSVMNYDFLDEKFPIRYIDKVVAIVPEYVNFANYSTNELAKGMFEKVAALNVKIVVVLSARGMNVSRFAGEKYEEVLSLQTQKYEISKFVLIK